MPVINTNVNALLSANALTANSRVLGGTMQQLSTGSRINSAKDDAAGLAIGSKMTSQIRGLDMAVRNANDGISLLQTAEGATSTMTDMLQRMRELAVQAANDTNASADRTALNTEFQQLSKEIARIGENTEWNGMNILNNTDVGEANAVVSTARTVKFQVGANADQTINIDLKSFTFGTGTAAVASESQFNLADGATNDLTDAKTFGVTIGGQAITATIAAKVVAEAATGAETTAIANALRTAITNTVGFENVSVTKVGQSFTIKDTEGRTITALTAVDDAAAAITLTAAIRTEVTAGSVATGAVAPAATDVFGGSARINNKDVTTLANANLAITALDAAIASVNTERSTMGSVMNRLSYAVDNLTSVSQNATESRSRVLDTDYAAATSKLAKSQIIAQAATAMLAQANQQPQTVLALLK